MNRSQKPIYFLTAYGIARKHGFEGTEEEWLESLTAFYLAQQAGYEGTIDDWLQDLNDPVPEFSIGTVTTLPGGSEATVKVSGSKRKPVLSFGIPRGLGMTDALPLVGGRMLGPIDMNGQQLSGLHEPASDDEAATMGFVAAKAGEAVKTANKHADAKVAKENVVNNFTTTEEGYVADARLAAVLNEKIGRLFFNATQTHWSTTNVMKIKPETTSGKTIALIGSVDSGGYPLVFVVTSKDDLTLDGAADLRVKNIVGSTEITAASDGSVITLSGFSPHGSAFVIMNRPFVLEMVSAS